MNYPVRDKHFAHKTFRLMHKASVPAEIGRDAFCIVAVVLHTEDAARYRGPVSFYNSQLMETLGFSKWDTFDKARQKAIDSGWLAYTGFGNRKPGLYHVTIPSQYSVVDDGVMEESYPENGYNQGYNQGYKDGYNQGVTEGITRGQLGVQVGVTSYPVPNPNPNPISCSEVKPPREQTVEVELKPEQCKFPLFPCSGKQKTWEATKESVDAWALAFPGVNVDQEMRRAHVWIMANLSKRKTASGMPKFLTTWLGKAQDRPIAYSNASMPIKQKVMDLPRLKIGKDGKPE